MVMHKGAPLFLLLRSRATVVDIIMSEKYPMAKDKGIDFQFQLDDLTSFPMPDDALVVVLTNLIDNAIEACEKIPQASDRHILLKMKMDERIALLGIENTTAEPVVIRDNIVQTTKNDPLAHGFGLRNVAAMIEQSSGMWFIEYREADKMFCFSASLPREKRSRRVKFRLDMHPADIVAGCFNTQGCHSYRHHNSLMILLKSFDVFVTPPSFLCYE